MNNKIDIEQARKELDKTFSGSSLLPEKAGYEEARKLHNGMVDKRPALIAQCRTAADIVDSVNFARNSKLEVAIRGGGHSVSGIATIDGGLMMQCET